MTRILLAVLFAAMATACTSGTSTDPGGGDNDAEAFKTQMDAFVRETLPRLQAEVGGTWGGYTAKFYEKGGNTGQWEYTAGGGTSRPPGTGKVVLDKVEAVLREQGMEITRPGITSDIAARKGNISVQVSRGLEADITSVSVLNVDFSSFDRLTSADGFAENAGTTELLK